MNLTEALTIAVDIANKPAAERTDIERALLVCVDYAAAENAMRGTRAGDVGRIPVTHPAHPSYANHRD